MSGNPLDKYKDTSSSSASSIAGCGWTEIQHNLCFVDDDGQILPAAGAQYRLQIPHGAAIYGVLDSNGSARHEGIGFGTVLLEVEPHIDDEKQLILKEIKQTLDEFIAAERKEKEKIIAQMQGKSDLEEDWEYTKAAGRGGRNMVEGVIEATVDLSLAVAKEALHLLGYFNPLTAPNSFERDVARTKQAKKELQAIANADWGIYGSLMNDDETQRLFKQFAREYLDAQHGLEITEGSAEVITVILGVVAAKAAGSVLSSGAGSSKLTQLGEKLTGPINQLIDVLKRARAKKKIKSEGNQRIESEVVIKDNNRSDDIGVVKENGKLTPANFGAQQTVLNSSDTALVKDADLLAASVFSKFNDIKNPDSPNFMGNSKTGPVLSGVLNRETGEIFYGFNQLKGEKNVMPDLHPVLEERRTQYLSEARSQGLGVEALGKEIPGIHSEVKAVSEALNNMSPNATSKDLEKLLIFNVRTTGSGKGTSIVRCDNCQVLTKGIPSISDNPDFMSGLPSIKGR